MTPLLPNPPESLIILLGQTKAVFLALLIWHCRGPQNLPDAEPWEMSRVLSEADGMLITTGWAGRHQRPTISTSIQEGFGPQAIVH